MANPLHIPDLIPRILSFIPDGATYKTATLVCQQWHTICAGELHWVASKYCNHLKTLFFKFPTEGDWDLGLMASNLNISIDMLMSNPKAPWEWEDTIHNPNMTWELIRDGLPKFGKS